MNVIQTNIPGVLIIEPRVFKDSRGYFFESFSQREFDNKVTPILGHSINFVQDNESMSSYGVMRGLHYQRMPYTQSKLVRCVKGAVLDVAVDIRKGSPTFGLHVSCLLTAWWRRYEDRCHSRYWLEDSYRTCQSLRERYEACDVERLWFSIWYQCRFIQLESYGW